jgi:hypothetical protein
VTKFTHEKILARRAEAPFFVTGEEVAMEGQTGYFGKNMKNSFITIARSKSRGKQNVTHWDVGDDMTAMMTLMTKI